MNLAIRVKPGSTCDLDQTTTRGDDSVDKTRAREKTDALGVELAELADLLFYAGQQGLLIVLQGRDTSGKDGTIRTLLRYLNAQSTRVCPFKVPTDAELSHDFLWRCHAKTPGRGEIVVFNRSHYEDVLVVRVRKLVEEAVWKKRYGHVNDFERLLVDEGAIVVKAFLHISKEEQEERLLARERDVEKAWKLNVGDWIEREHWDEYTEAYEAALSRCSTEWAPWHVVPADRKWLRDLAVLELLVETLRPYREGWLEYLEELGDAARGELEAYRKG
ncbi:MAG: PPK2 family polyphosphate kinase, partial [Fimbriimonadaceae bacterium]